MGFSNRTLNLDRRKSFCSCVRLPLRTGGLRAQPIANSISFSFDSFSCDEDAADADVAAPTPTPIVTCCVGEESDGAESESNSKTHKIEEENHELCERAAESE